MVTLVVEIYEPSRSFPVVVHLFNGETKAEAKGYFEAHKASDAFLRGCTSRRRRYGTVKCSTKIHWETWEEDR